MQIDYRIDTGQQGRDVVRQRVAGLLAWSSGGYIGITNNPQVRAAKHTARYRRLVVLHRTSSDAIVRSLEADLVQFFWGRIDNRTGGGGGAPSVGPYYLYVALR